MKQFELKSNRLLLTSKPSPIFARILILFFSIISILLPIGSIIGTILSGNKFHFGFLIAIGIFSLIGFYLLRVFLWNSFGKEVIIFNKNEIIYEADYKWFKDGKKTINLDVLSYSIKPIGYKEDNFGTLVIESTQNSIESVIKMPNEQLELLIRELSTYTNS